MNLKQFFLFILSVFSLQILQAKQPQTPSPTAIKVATAYAQRFFRGGIDDGVPYLGPGKGDLVWVFTVNKNAAQFPTKETIKTNVAIAREKRIAAEIEFENYRQTKDIEGMRETRRRIRAANVELRDEENFASVYVADYQNGYRVIALRMHHGLPPHFTAYSDAETKARQHLNKSVVNHSGYLYLNPEFVLAGFAGTTDTAYVNLFFPDEAIQNNLGLVEFSEDYYATLGTQKIPQQPLESIQSEPPIDPQIGCVPDYGYGHRSCSMVSTVQILGYWERKYQHQCGNYDHIIYGGDWNYDGWTCRDGTNPYDPAVSGYGEGAQGLAWDEIGDRMEWIQGHDSNPWDAMSYGAQIMNEPFRSRDYDTFHYQSVTNITITNKSQMYTSFDDFRDEVDLGQPFQYCYWGKLRYEMDSTIYFQDTNHAMVGCGYYDEDPSDPTNNALHWRAVAFGGGSLTPDFQWINDESGCDLDANNQIAIEIRRMGPGDRHWSGNMVSNTTWSGNIYMEGDVVVSPATTLTIAPGAVVNLNGHTLHISGNGNIIRQAGVTVNPDIQLLSGYTLKGQYPTLAAAFTAAQPGDAIHLASDDTLHTAWEIPAGITFKVTNEASLVLEGDLDVAYGATFLVDEHTYIKCYDHIDIQGGTMEVGPGARLEFDHYSKIKVKGILNAEGTVSDRNRQQG